MSAPVLADQGTVRGTALAHQRLPLPPGCHPCPFCGTTDLAFYHTALGYWILCRTAGCIAVGPQTQSLGDARQAWNTRRPPVTLEDVGA